MELSKMNIRNNLNTLRRYKAGNVVIVFAVIQILAIIFSLAYPETFRYLDQSNLRVIFRAIPTLGIIALGVNLLMIAGEFDLSVGATFTFAALIMAKLFNAGLSVWLAVLIALAIGCAIGALNG